MPAYVCSRNLDSCQDCPDWCNSENYNGKLFADPHTGEVSEWCPDYLDKQECEQDSSFWTIVEYEVRE